MTQVYLDDGTVVPVTVLEAGPCNVLQIRIEERDGYSAVQLGFGDKPRRLASRSERGQVAKLDSKRRRASAASAAKAEQAKKAGDEPKVELGKAGCEPQRFVREFRGETDSTVGDVLKVDIFEGVASVDVTGTSKGRGFAGVMKRHNFSGQRASHGVKKVHRHAGGTGCSASPSRLFKGKRMAGQYGNVKTTTRNLEVVRVDVENNLLLVRGAVPGPKGGYVTIRETNKV
ncbi:MAG: 50S ribosomal protein L3 [Planctomycetota bacterium]